MNASKFIHVVCWLVQNANQPIDLENLQQQITDHLWSNKKIRVQRWKAKIGQLEPQLDLKLVKRNDANNPVWLEWFALADEIILSETMSRVLFAVLLSQTDCDDVRDIAQDVLTDNIEIRKRVVKISKTAPVPLKTRSSKFAELKALNEHITDLMLSQLPDQSIARVLAVKKEAFNEFANCAGTYQPDVIKQANIALGLAFSTGIQNLASPNSCNEDINQKIIEDIADLFPVDSLSNFPVFVKAVAASA